WGQDHVRRHGAPEPHTLDDYRIRHALYKSDPDLRAAHAACPWLLTWDDHEVQNDYANDRSEHLDTPAWFLERRAAAYRAYYEHMPLRRSMVPFGPHMRMFSRVGFGRLAQFHMLDDRQYRSHQPCAPPGRGGANIVEECEARLDLKLTMLGDAQEQWLAAELDRSQARWDLIGPQTLMAQLDRQPRPGRADSSGPTAGTAIPRRGAACSTISASASQVTRSSWGATCTRSGSRISSRISTIHARRWSRRSSSGPRSPRSSGADRKTSTRS